MGVPARHRSDSDRGRCRRRRALPSARLARILALLSAGAGSESGTARLCDVGVDVTGAHGAGILLVCAGVARGSLGTTNEVARTIEELHYTFAEGPGVDAFHQGRPVLEPDLADPTTARWSAFSPPAVGAGVRAIFSFPLHTGAIRLGALDLFRLSPGPLSNEQHADALVLAAVAARTVLASQAHARRGMVAGDLETGADFHDVVHQASGMVAAQLGVSLDPRPLGV